MNIYILLDRSGSMHSLWNEAITGINEYAEGIKQIASNIYVAVFDSVSYDVLRSGRGEWRPIGVEEASPRAGTPLLDAAGRLLNEVFKDNPSKAVIVFMTDGEENSSSECTADQIRSRIKDAEAREWGVVFLGANFDKVADQGSRIGVAADATVNFRKGLLGRGFDMQSAKTQLYASGMSASAAFSYNAAERQELAGEDTPVWTPLVNTVGASVVTPPTPPTPAKTARGPKKGKK